MLGITEQFRDNWVLLQINGEIDMATGPELRQRIVQYVQEGHVHIIIDLTEVDFIDSTGLGVLIGGLKRTRSHDGDLNALGSQNPQGDVQTNRFRCCPHRERYMN